MGREKTAALSHPLDTQLLRLVAVRTEVERPGLATPNSFPGLLVPPEELPTLGLSDWTLGSASYRQAAGLVDPWGLIPAQRAGG